MTVLRVSKIFYTLHGEGFHTGKAAVFVRFFDCNKHCDYCDEPSDQQSFEEISEEAILKKALETPARFVVLTGGEPSIYDLRSLIAGFKAQGFYVAVETNGHNPENIKGADWISYSPKNWDKVDIFPAVREVKLVVNRDLKIEKILKVRGLTDLPVYIQPESFLAKPDFDNIHFCVNLVKDHPDFRLSLQTHKLIGIQ